MRKKVRKPTVHSVAELVQIRLERDILLKELHSQGKTTRQISEKIGIGIGYTSVRLREFGLKANPRPNNQVSDTEARCNQCQKIKLFGEFSLGKNNYRVQVCNSCCYINHTKRSNKSVKSYFTYAVSRLKARCNKDGMVFDLTGHDMAGLWDLQEGRCFYTDVPMEPIIGGRNRRDRPSIDKIVPEEGYIQKNVVICTHRANVIKNDMNLEEMKLWTPGWYERLQERWFLERDMKIVAVGKGKRYLQLFEEAQETRRQLEIAVFILDNLPDVDVDTSEAHRILETTKDAPTL